MKRFNYISFFILFTLLVVACREKEKSGDVVILYTTDVHGYVLPYDFTKQRPSEASLANASTIIKEVREEYGRDMLLFDAGDLYQGTPSMYYYNYHSVDEMHLATRVVNYLQYDGLVVGNHDLEAGEDIYLNRVSRQLEPVWLGANAVDTRTGRGMFRPYKIYERHGFKIAVLGLITPETGEQLPKNLTPHLSFKLMTEYAKRWVEEIKANENPDYIVAITHAGIKDFEIVNKTDTIKDGINTLVNNVRGIDLLLFGHDHGVYEGSLVNQWGDSVRLLQPSHNGTEIGRVDIHFDRKDDVVVCTTSTQRINLADCPVDEDYMKTFGGAIDTINNFLDSPLGYLDEDFDMEGTLYRQTNAMDFIHHIQLDATGADISFASALSSFKTIPSGPITLRTLFSLYRYDNQIHKIWMTGADIKKFLEYGYDRQFGVMKSADSHLLAFKYDDKGNITYGRFGPDLVVPQYNYTSAAGINYEIDVRKPLGNRVNIISLADGSPFNLNQQYTVAISSYQAAGGGGFITRGLGWSEDDIAYHTLSESSKNIIFLITSYIQRLQHVTTHPNGKWRTIPSDWSENNGPKDAALLLPYIAK